ncbi:MAG: hypothetical protein JXA44_09950 [Methanospirillaceae archaeon]|nr:hypothetical protein [Methanospirillaceae archaeon]
MNNPFNNLRILFFTEAQQDQINFYIEMLQGLNACENVQFEVNRDDFWRYDVILLMYSDCEKYLEKIREQAPHSKIGVVDPRKAEGEILKGDFAVVQGLEEENWFSDYYYDIFRYDFHPINPCTIKQHHDKDEIIIGTHGNKIHLHTMYPYLSNAIEALALDFKVEFRAYYNIKEFGTVDIELFPSGNVDFKEIQWSRDIFRKSLSEVDIGVVPNLIPIRDVQKMKRSITSYPALFNEHETDNLVRYKGTSNIGRLYPFAQLGIPVVADLYPSSCCAIEPGVTGFFGGSAGMWYRSLKVLASSAELRQKIGQNMQNQYLKTATPEVFNRKFVPFLRGLWHNPQIPIPQGLAQSHEQLRDSTFIKGYVKVCEKKTTLHRLSRLPDSVVRLLRHHRKIAVTNKKGRFL